MTCKCVFVLPVCEHNEHHERMQREREHKEMKALHDYDEFYWNERESMDREYDRAMSESELGLDETSPW